MLFVIANSTLSIFPSTLLKILSTSLTFWVDIDLSCVAELVLISSLNLKIDTHDNDIKVIKTIEIVKLKTLLLIFFIMGFSILIR